MNSVRDIIDKVKELDGLVQEQAEFIKELQRQIAELKNARKNTRRNSKPD